MPGEAGESTRLPSEAPSEAPSRTIGLEQATRLCEAHFFTPREIRALDGYQDANYRVEDRGGRRYTLKLSRVDEPSEGIVLERRALAHLERLEWPGVPRLVLSRGGLPLETVELAQGPRRARVLTWVEGTPLETTAPWSDGLLVELGGFLGRLDEALAQIGAGGERDLLWDLAQMADLLDDLQDIGDPEDRTLVESAMSGYLEALERFRGRLPRSLIHNDANPHNVLVSSADGRAATLVGLIDFGDLVITETIHELAIAAAYLGFDATDPWRATWPLIEGYDAARRLRDLEIEILLPAIKGRLATSILMAERRRRAGTADAYALVSLPGARRTLRRLGALEAIRATDQLRGHLRAGSASAG